MIPDVKNEDWFEDIVDDASPPEASVSWWQAERQQARENISILQTPTRKQEAWRYSNISALFKQRYQYTDEQFSALFQDDIDSWVYAEEQSYRLVFANGRYISALSSHDDIADGIKIGSLREMINTDPDLVKPYLSENTDKRMDKFSELNRALYNDGLFVFLPAQKTLRKPIEVVYLTINEDASRLNTPRSVVILQTGAQATLVERYISLGDAADYFVNGVTEIDLQVSARLQHVRIQNESRQARHLSRVMLSQKAASEYKSINIALGGLWSRSDIYVDMDGEHARCELDGLYLVGDKQHTDYHLDVQHNQPQTTSRENFRGIIYGKGRAVFDGRILVNKVAQKTDAQLTNKNLLLVDNAEVDTKPQLEIYADDVKCSHGTTVGRIDPMQIYYLRSRGISESVARKMLYMGFAEQILADIDDKDVRKFIQGEIEQTLNEEKI